MELHSIVRSIYSHCDLPTMGYEEIRREITYALPHTAPRYGFQPTLCSGALDA